MKARKKNTRERKNRGYALTLDLIVIAIGIVIALVLARWGVIDAVVYALRDYTIIASFCAGILFTSTFTIAPASIAIVHLASGSPLPVVAFWGALGAVLGDLILFFFIKDRFAIDLVAALPRATRKHLFNSFHLGFMKWLSPVVGALIIASPLPDEIGISLLGMSKIRISVLIPISFVMNFAGIYFIVGFANLIS